MIDASSSNDDEQSENAADGSQLRLPTEAALRGLGPTAPGAKLPELVWRTADLPGIGGRIKDAPDDFVVEEIPLYEPCGNGEHLFLQIEKRDLSHEKLVMHMGHALNVSRHDIGTAGMKDRRAITRQWVSAPARCEDRIANIENDQVRVLAASKHTNALKTAHCKGNRFTIRIRFVASDAAERVAAIRGQLSNTGFPNYYGPQRFGISGETLNIGYELIAGLKKPASIAKSRRKFLIRLGISALQSAVFNDVIAARLRSEKFDRVLLGDMMTFPRSRSVFEVADVDVEQRRFRAGEILITGPMFGVKMRGPSGEPQEIELDALAKRDLRVGQFAAWKSVAPGGRRPLAVFPDFHDIKQDGDTLQVEMTLPTGCFATVVLGEMMKC